MPEVQVFHDNLHHVLLLNYVEKWLNYSFQLFQNFQLALMFVAILLKYRLILKLLVTSHFTF